MPRTRWKHRQVTRLKTDAEEEDNLTGASLYSRACKFFICGYVTDLKARELGKRQQASRVAAVQSLLPREFPFR